MIPFTVEHKIFNIAQRTNDPKTHTHFDFDWAETAAGNEWWMVMSEGMNHHTPLPARTLQIWSSRVRGMPPGNNELSKVTSLVGSRGRKNISSRRPPHRAAFKLLFVFHTETTHRLAHSTLAALFQVFLTRTRTLWHTGRSRHFIISGFTSCLEGILFDLFCVLFL